MTLPAGQTDVCVMCFKPLTDVEKHYYECRCEACEARLDGRIQRYLKGCDDAELDALFDARGSTPDNAMELVKMKFDCGNLGESLEEKKARLKEWHTWFAWHPIRIGPHDYRWLETVVRKGRFQGDYWEWQYTAHEHA